MTSRNTLEPSINLPAVNPWVILLGIIPYLIPRLGLFKKDTSATKIGIGLVATFISIVVLFVAFIGLTSSAHTADNRLLLVIAVQLQLVMNYVVVRTNYLEASREITIRECKKRGIYDETSQRTCILVITGLPFIATMVLALALTF